MHVAKCAKQNGYSLCPYGGNLGLLGPWVKPCHTNNKIILLAHYIKDIEMEDHKEHCTKRQEHEALFSWVKKDVMTIDTQPEKNNLDLNNNRKIQSFRPKLKCVKIANEPIQYFD